jgi:hypothetical protein
MRRQGLQKPLFLSKYLKYLIWYKRLKNNSPHPNGTESLDISADGRYIVTISKEVKLIK